MTNLEIQQAEHEAAMARMAAKGIPHPTITRDALQRRYRVEFGSSWRGLATWLASVRTNEKAALIEERKRNDRMYEKSRTRNMRHVKIADEKFLDSYSCTLSEHLTYMNKLEG